MHDQNLGTLASKSRKGRVFWLAPGIHRLGRNQFSQIIPKDRQVFIGAPGAVIDGQHRNLYAFTGQAHRRHDRAPHDPELRHRRQQQQGVVNHDSGTAG